MKNQENMDVEVEEKSLFPLIFPHIPDECQICGEVHKFEHCPLVGCIVEHIKDTETPSYAHLTLPKALRVKNLQDGRKTVIANETIPKGVQFGPFISKTSSIMDMRIDFPIKIFLRDDDKVYLESYEELFCNWMCFVLPASNSEEQNLFCYQVNTNIYFCSSKDIKAGDELRVWYSPFYAEKMGIQPFAKPPEFVHSSDEEFQEIFSSLQTGATFQPPEKAGQNTPPKRKKRQRRCIKQYSWEKVLLDKTRNCTLPGELLGAKARRKEWHCQTCGHLETNVAAYARHLMLHNIPGPKKNIPCPYCPKYFRKDGLHSKVHIDTCKKLKEANKAKDNGIVLTDPNTTSDNNNSAQVKLMEDSQNISNGSVSECGLIFNQNDKASSNSLWNASSLEKLQIVGATISFGEETKALIQADSFVESTLLNEISQPLEGFSAEKDKGSEMILNDAKKVNTITTKPASDIEEKTSSEKNLTFESLADNLSPKSHLNNPILDLSYDLDFQLTKSLTEMINEDCNLEKSLLLSKQNRSLGLFENVQGAGLLEPDISVPHPTSLESSPFYSIGKPEFMQTNFTSCDDVTDEERNRIVENLLCETDNRFLNSDYEMTDGCISENPDSECNNQPTFENKKDNKNSPKRSKRGDEFTCDICEKGFSKQLYLFRHLRKHTGEFRCNTCFQVFARKETLESHKVACVEEQKQKQSLQGVVRLNCNLCKLQFFSLKALDEHMGQHYCKSDTWKCACGMSSSELTLMGNHNCLFEKEKIICVGCTRKFSTKEEFVEHKNYPISRRLRNLSKLDKSLMCEFCGMMFKSHNGIRIHRESNHGPRKHECSLCKKRFKRNDTLMLHIKKSHEQPTVECPLCQKKFADESLYKSHYEQTHTPSNFKCDVCDKEFRQKGNLMKHYKSHSSITYFDCELCSMKFKTKQNLNYHSLSHQPSEKSYKCEACCRYYLSPYQLKRHKKLSHGQMYRCKYCQMGIRYPFKLKKHLMAKHKDKITEWESAEAIQAMRQPLDSEVRNNNANKQVNNVPILDILQKATDSVLQDEPLSSTGEREEVNCNEDDVRQPIDLVRQETVLTESVEEEGQTTLNLLTLNIGSLPAAENAVCEEQIRESLDDAVVNLPLTVMNGFPGGNVSPISLQQIPISLEIGDNQDASNVISILNNNHLVNFSLNVPNDYQLVLDNTDASGKQLEEANNVHFLNINTLDDSNNGSIILTDENFTQPGVPMENNVIFYIIDAPESDLVT